MSGELVDGGSRVLLRELRHPTQPTLVRLALYRQDGRYLATEERFGSTKVIGTLGSAASRETAEALLAGRERQLSAQRYAVVAATGAGAHEPPAPPSGRAQAAAPEATPPR